MTQPSSDTKPPRAMIRSAARLGAVQALYQMDIAHTDLSDVLTQFESIRLGEAADDSDNVDADFELLSALVTGVVAEQREIDPLISAHLATGWKLHRLDATLRAILRAGAYELKQRHDVPAKVAISEYIDVAKAFFDGEEPKVVNGVLDNLAREFHRDVA